MPRATLAVQLKNRHDVLAMARQDPRPSDREIARKLNLPRTTVVYIIKRFSGREDDLRDRPRPGRPVACKTRWRRCNSPLYGPCYQFSFSFAQPFEGHLQKVQGGQDPEADVRGNVEVGGSI